MKKAIEKADILIEALPYINMFKGKYFVIKFGGRAMSDWLLIEAILEDIVFLSHVGIRPILVHGGGPFINERLKRLRRHTRFVKGLRVTSQDDLKIVEDELGKLNKKLVARINFLGGKALGLTPRGRCVVSAQILSGNLGLVGRVRSIDAKVIKKICENGTIPVISPIGKGKNGCHLNINADSVSSFLASAIKAEKLVLLTDVKGIMRKAKLISTLGILKAIALTKLGIIQEGMIPKTNACIQALKNGVKKTHIISAHIPHALLLEIFTKKGIGTEIVR